MHEAQLHEQNSFVTLTYRETGPSLVYSDFQAFMRRVRKRNRSLVRFYMAGEYGELSGRPHFHAILFGVGFPDQVLLRRTEHGSLYRSASLDQLWPHGYASVGEVTFQSAAYVARYVMKKITGEASTRHYQVVDQDGVITQRVPEFNRMSLKPGIGATWYEKYRSDVFPAGTVHTNGHYSRAPRYYDKLEERQVDSTLELAKEERRKKMRPEDQTPARLSVQETVTSAKLQLNRRGL